MPNNLKVGSPSNELLVRIGKYTTRIRGMGERTLTEHLGELFALPEPVIKHILLGASPLKVSVSMVWNVRNAAERVLEGESAKIYAHARRAPRFRIPGRASLHFLNLNGRQIARGLGEIKDLSLCGALIHLARTHKKPLPLQFYQLLVHIGKMKIPARLTRVEGEPISSIAVEFLRMDWESRQTLKALMIQQPIKVKKESV